MGGPVDQAGLEEAVDADFSGVVRVRHGDTRLTVARGLADRAGQIPIEAATRFATASAAKTITALIALRLVETDTIGLDTAASDLIPELAQLRSDVTVRHLLEHTSGMGDYLDEGEIDDIEAFRLPVPVQQLRTPGDLLALCDLPAAADPGEPFRYNNSGYVLLAVLSERAAGRDWFDLADEVLAHAGMGDSGFFASDDLPARCALGYLESGETNEQALPVRGSGDGGLYLTVDDVERFWTALHDGRLLGPALRDQMTTVRQSRAGSHYGWGLWLDETAACWSMEGMDAGVSFRSTYRPADRSCSTVVSNTTRGAWPVVSILERPDLGA